MKNDGGAAFPFAMHDGDKIQFQYGMTLRDWFAGQALSSLLNRQYLDVPVCPKCKSVKDDPGHHYAEISYAYADAMMAEREK